MLTQECLRELRNSWLPNMTDAALERVISLLEKGSPLLIHGSFTRTMPMGCLATHIGWKHPATARHNQDAGIRWLHSVARLNPATSCVIRAWDQAGDYDWQIRADLLAEFKECRKARRLAQARKPRRRLARTCEI